MSERTRASVATPQGLSPEDVRRRLEGRAEVLEAARARYAALESLLASRRWKHRLRTKPGQVAQWREHEPEVAEALERAKRRAAQEGWPEDTPVLATVRELAARRTRLEALARRRLASVAPVSGAPSLEEDLSRLDALVRKQDTLALGPGEVLVFEGRQKADASARVPPVLLFLLGSSAVLAVCAILVEKVLGAGGEWSMLLLLLATMPWFVVGMRSGRARLTSERLLWEPLWREPVAVPLDSIPEGGIHLDPTWLNLRVEGERLAHLRHQYDAPQLAVLLELHRQPPLRGAARAGVRLADVALYPAELRQASGPPKRGHAVLRPDGVSFIPEGTGPQALLAVTGRPAALPVEPEHVLEQLRWLTDTEFDACVARVVEATGGLRWSSWDAGYRPGAPVWKQIRITRGGLALTGQVDWAGQEATERILRSWPQAARPEGEG